ncbi:MAG: hypothetical protein AB7I25_13535 [Vicinamibacterales bacterium]
MRVPVVLSCGGLGALLLGGLACSPTQPSRPPEPQPSAYWGGDLTPVVSVKELMRDVIDPLSDNIFLSVGTRVSAQGIEEWAPKTDEDWQKVRTGAVAMAEVSHLLKVPRPFAPKGDENNSTGPDAPELSPAQIQAKLDRDPVLWQAKVEALRNVGRAVMEIVERKDVAALEQAAEDLDQACEQCHLDFWYPNQRALMKRLGR